MISIFLSKSKPRNFPQMNTDYALKQSYSGLTMLICVYLSLSVDKIRLRSGSVISDFARPVRPGREVDSQA
jgi:hypothetical protein